MAVKRMNGEGSIRKKMIKGKIYWEGRYTDSNGKQRSVSGKTQSEVRDKLKQALVKTEKLKKELRAKEEGYEYYDKDMTLNEWYDIYFDKFATNIKDVTKVRHQEIYNKHFKDSIGYKKMKYISEEDLLDLVCYMKNSNLSNGSIKTNFSILGKLFNKAISKDIIQKNPVKLLVIKDTGSKNPKRGLSVEEINLFLRVVEEKYDYMKPFFMFLINTGCRIGEAISIEWGDISNDMKFCEINKTRVRYKGVYKDTSPKNSASKRKVPLNDNISNVLYELKQTEIEKGHFSLNKKVFLSKQKKVMEATCVEKQTKRICKIIRDKYDESFPDISPHWFRHTFATFGVSSNIPMIYIQKICGWSNVNMLVKVYGHMNEEQALNAVNNLCIAKNN